MNQKRPETYQITDPDQLQAVASPRRQDIVDRLAAYGPLSIRELAAHVGARPTALYHHMTRLIAVGLVLEAGTRVWRRRREQLYQTFAPRMRFSEAMLEPGNLAVMSDIVAAQTRQMARDFEAAQTSPVRLTEGQGRNHTFYRLVGRPTPAQLARINACLIEIAEVLWHANDENAELIAFGCTMSPLDSGAPTKA